MLRLRPAPAVRDRTKVGTRGMAVIKLTGIVLR
jgi:hypothetical protein